MDEWVERAVFALAFCFLALALVSAVPVGLGFAVLLWGWTGQDLSPALAAVPQRAVVDALLAVPFVLMLPLVGAVAALAQWLPLGPFEDEEDRRRTMPLYAPGGWALVMAWSWSQVSEVVIASTWTWRLTVAALQPFVLGFVGVVVVVWYAGWARWTVRARRARSRA